MASQAEERLEGGRLRVQFARRDDRYVHEIYLADAGTWHGMLGSVEGTPDDAWPPSPPFQSLHVERRVDGRSVALLVGMAGTSHWSASVELDAAAERVRVEVACRVRGADRGTLASCYQARGNPTCDVAVTDECAVVLASGDCQCALRLEIDRQLSDSRLLQTAPDTIAVQPLIPDSEAAHTVRWAYVVRVVCNERTGGETGCTGGETGCHAHAS